MLDRRVVAQLQHDSTLEGLKVGHTRLDLEAVQATCPVEDGIPGAKATMAIERHLSAESPEREPVAESAKDTDLPSVSERIPVREEPKAWYEPDSDAEPTDLLESYVSEQAAFETIDLAG